MNLDGNKPEYFRHVMSQLEDVPGNFVELGFGKGSSANMIVDLMNDGLVKRDIWLFDSFRGFPDALPEDGPHNKRIKGTWTCPSEPAYKLADKIDTNVRVVEGYFENTLSQYDGSPIALLHLDCDLYNSYRVALDGLFKYVSIKGIVMFDEYKSDVHLRRFPGASKAIDEFCVANRIEPSQIVRAVFGTKGKVEKAYLIK